MADEGTGVNRHGEAVFCSVTGDRDLFATMVQEHSRAIHAYLARRGGQQTADELLTEVWLRAWRSRTSYRLDWPGPRPWLYGIARNALRAHWRLKTDQPLPFVELTVDPWSDVDERLDAERLRPAITAALAALDGQTRELLLLVAWSA